mmetsp:Transcript_6432/g.20618  ORF Transcript_6432/g.20618 Transcript_6432/m.20618 type:complete len:231 (-) Transcript_6432:481-1173(-)
MSSSYSRPSDGGGAAGFTGLPRRCARRCDRAGGPSVEDRLEAFGRSGTRMDVSGTQHDVSGTIAVVSAKRGESTLAAAGAGVGAAALAGARASAATASAASKAASTAAAASASAFQALPDLYLTGASPRGVGGTHALSTTKPPTTTSASESTIAGRVEKKASTPLSTRSASSSSPIAPELSESNASKSSAICTSLTWSGLNLRSFLIVCRSSSRDSTPSPFLSAILRKTP